MRFYIYLVDADADDADADVVVVVDAALVPIRSKPNRINEIATT